MHPACSTVPALDKLWMFPLLQQLYCRQGPCSNRRVPGRQMLAIWLDPCCGNAKYIWIRRWTQWSCWCIHIQQLWQIFWLYTILVAVLRLIFSCGFTSYIVHAALRLTLIMGFALYCIRAALCFTVFMWLYDFLMQRSINFAKFSYTLRQCFMHLKWFWKELY